MSNHFNSFLKLMTVEQQQQLQQEKIEAREQLLASPSKNAKKKVDSILFPDCWKLSSDVLTWDESLPNSDGETDT